MDTESTQDRDGGAGALRALGGLRMPEGARERMLAGAQRGIRVRRSVRRGGAVAAGVAVVALVLLVVAGPQTGSSSPIGELLAAQGVSGQEGPLGAGDELYAGRLRVSANGRLELRTASGATVEAAGPAALALSPEQLSMYEGTAMIDGELTVDAPSCRVAVDGRAELSIQEPAVGQTMSTVSVTVFAGTVQRIGPAISCHFEDLTVATAGRARARARPAETPQGLAAPRPGLTPSVPSTPAGPSAEVAAPGRSPLPATGRIARNARNGQTQDPLAQAPGVPAPTAIAAPAPPPPEPAPSALELELREQTRQYDQALALLPSDPSSAMARFRAMRIRWPDSALREQIDLRVVQALVRLGRDTEARREATSFLQRHPRSRQAGDMRRIIEAPAPAQP